MSDRTLERGNFTIMANMRSEIKVLQARIETLEANLKTMTELNGNQAATIQKLEDEKLFIEDGWTAFVEIMLEPEIESQKARIAELEEREKRLLAAFGHTTQGSGTCTQCGLDSQDKIHYHWSRHDTRTN